MKRIKESQKIIYACMDHGRFTEARNLIKTELKKISGLENFFLYEVKLYGYLIDLGAESNSENDVIEGETFFEKNEEKIKGYITSSLFHYTLANAKSARCSIFYSNSPGVKSPQIIKDLLQSPINHHWAALKAIEYEANKKLRPQILINLANSLVNVGRLVEAMQFFDTVLREIPYMPQALISRGDALFHISRVTNCNHTIALHTQIFISYDSGIKSSLMPIPLLDQYREAHQHAAKQLAAFGFKISDIQLELKKTNEEYNGLTDYRRFSLDNFISLNEHALYCNCIAAEKDDIQIGIKGALFTNDILPKLELLLNRMKSEYGLARWLFYQNVSNTQEIDLDMRYSELFEGESINGRTEMLRTSFRLCYGILDKIAFGICRLYDLTQENENVLFEAFWNPGKNSTRWDKINGIRNFHLSALYSIASDLNTKNGQLKVFKEWRNKLEHRILILRENQTLKDDILKVFDDKNFIEVVSIDDFKDQTLHLLQLTRAAIFSFVCCVRLETIQDANDTENATLIGFKEV